MGSVGLWVFVVDVNTGFRLGIFLLGGRIAILERFGRVRVLPVHSDFRGHILSFRASKCDYVDGLLSGVT